MQNVSYVEHLVFQELSPQSHRPLFGGEKYETLLSSKCLMQIGSVQAEHYRDRPKRCSALTDVYSCVWVTRSFKTQSSSCLRTDMGPFQFLSGVPARGRMRCRGLGRHRIDRFDVSDHPCLITGVDVACSTSSFW